MERDFLKKTAAYFARREEMKFAAIRIQSEEFHVSWMCRLAPGFSERLLCVAEAEVQPP